MSGPITEAEKATTAKLAAACMVGLVLVLFLFVMWVSSFAPDVSPAQKAGAKAPQTEAEAWNAKAHATARQRVIDELADAARELQKAQHELVFRKCLLSGMETIERCAERAR